MTKQNGTTWNVLTASAAQSPVFAEVSSMIPRSLFQPREAAVGEDGLPSEFRTSAPSAFSAVKFRPPHPRPPSAKPAYSRNRDAIFSQSSSRSSRLGGSHSSTPFTTQGRQDAKPRRVPARRRAPIRKPGRRTRLRPTCGASRRCCRFLQQSRMRTFLGSSWTRSPSGADRVGGNPKSQNSAPSAFSAVKFRPPSSAFEAGVGEAGLPGERN
jgi:hypothetical protein